MSDFMSKVKQALEEGSVEKSERLFIPKQGPDKYAAAKRFAILDGILSDWYFMVNNANSREMPEELLNLYDAACTTMLKIREMEQAIVLGKEV